MPTAQLVQPADTKNKYEDLSGVDTTKSKNPFEALILACNNDASDIARLYTQHRETRNAQQKAAFLVPDTEFPGLIIDGILRRLEDQTLEPGYVDPRHCLVFWARPPSHIKELFREIQTMLKALSPNLWLMPVECAHLTVLEITHSKSPIEVERIVSNMSPVITPMVNYVLDPAHRSKLCCPYLSFDTAALALSFVPQTCSEDGLLPTFTYHHLRRNLFDIATCPDTKTEYQGIELSQRYVVPSAHVTVGRFLKQDDHQTIEQRRAFIEGIDAINGWLHDTHWNTDTTVKSRSGATDTGSWTIGKGTGLTCRKGNLWYGGGRSVALGRGS